MTTQRSTPQPESAAPDRDSIEAFLHRMWDHTTGYVWVPTWNIESDRFDSGPAHTWPADTDAVIARVVAADAAGLDCYYSTNVFRTPSRAVGGSVAPSILHADIDRDPTAEDIDRLDALDAMTVRSGTGEHLHAYVFLNGPVDVVTYHRLEDRLSVYLDADAKVRDNDVLRIPGTSNRKAEPSPVTIERESESVWSVAELSELLPEVSDSAAAVDDTATITPEPVSVLPGRVAMSLDARSGDRSADTFAVLKESARSGLTMGQAMSVVLDVPELAERWSSRSASFVAGEICRAFAAVGSVPGAGVLSAGDLIGAGRVATPAPERAPAGSLRDRMLTLDQLGTLPSPEPLVEGLLYRNTLAQLVGQPGTYKSFLAMGIACALASGQSTFEDHPVGHTGPVIYVAAEGASGMQARIEGWAQSTIPVDAGAQALLRRNLLVLPEVVDITSAETVDALIVAAAEVGAVLIVLDTRARMTVGADENSAKEMGLAIAECERLRTATGATVLVVHHSGKQGASGRGSNAWDGAVWTQLSTRTSEGGNLTVTADKHKEIASGTDHTFILKPVVVDLSHMPNATETQRSTLVVQNGPYQRESDLSHRLTPEERISDPVRQSVSEVVSTWPESRGPTRAEIVRDVPESLASRATVHRRITALVKEGVLIEVAPKTGPSRFVPGHTSDE